jgi:hypothetical protein
MQFITRRSKAAGIGDGTSSDNGSGDAANGWLRALAARLPTALRGLVAVSRRQSTKSRCTNDAHAASNK